MEHTHTQETDEAKMNREHAIADVKFEIEDLENKRSKIEGEILDLLHSEDAHDSEIARLEFEMAGIAAQIDVLGNGLEHGTVTADSVKEKKNRSKKRR